MNKEEFNSNENINLVRGKSKEEILHLLDSLKQTISDGKVTDDEIVIQKEVLDKLYSKVRSTNTVSVIRLVTEVLITLGGVLVWLRSII